MSPNVKQIYITFCGKYPLERAEAYRFKGVLQQKFDVIGPMDTIEICILNGRLSTSYTAWGCL